jgi:hypothetical protein
VPRRGATGMLEGADPKEALRGFAEVVRMELEKGEWCAALHLARLRAVCNAMRHSLRHTACCKAAWAVSILTGAVGAATRGFKALKQIVKLHYKLGNHDEMLRSYRWVAWSPLVAHRWNKHLPALNPAAAPSRECVSPGTAVGPGRGPESRSSIPTSCNDVGPVALLVEVLH